MPYPRFRFTNETCPSNLEKTPINYNLILSPPLANNS